MLPISLLVSLEFVKLFQSYFMQEDSDGLKNKHKLKTNTSSINEELGMVEYIFSDKTGTLTCNKMDFKYFVIGNEVYGDQAEVLDRF
jgi:P-type E1-E2 ATPase